MASDSVAPLLLSRPLEDRMPVYPGDPGVRIRPALTVAQDGVAVMALEIGSHAGTHVDAPCHTVPGGRTVEGLTWDELCGDTLVLGLAGLAPGEPISAARLAPLLPGTDAQTPARLLLATGWDRHWRDGLLRARHPFLTGEAAAMLWDRGIRLLGVDMLSPDPTGLAGEPDLPAHAAFLGGDGIIVENLVGLDALRPAGAAPRADWSARLRLEVHPLPLAGGDGAPARVLAWPTSGGTR
ncbi:MULTISPECIES: cyclase family protein [Micrococcus]|nr:MULTISPECIES: cyclase family protein [Micrococcus]CVN78032.1 Kynurenine formamidase [Streptococcus pneumoniae]MCR4488370.1 cyclase family protein [Micrococcus luteus]MCV7457929.1 cyclase family protein [Micrococcus luteus]MCV7465188.1 cyclase family protein [Micrococcus luteus]MCV7501019.1 cyclase family protein [Micrococcus luteus]